MIISTSNFRLIYITSDPSQALLAARSSVDFIMVDLERIGKFESGARTLLYPLISQLISALSPLVSQHLELLVKL